MKPHSVAAAFIQDINQHAAMSEFLDEQNEELRSQAAAHLERLCRRLESANKDANEHLAETTRGYLEGRVRQAQFQRTVEEHCCLYSIHEYQDVDATPTPLPEAQGNRSARRAR